LKLNYHPLKQVVVEFIGASRFGALLKVGGASMGCKLDMELGTRPVLVDGSGGACGHAEYLDLWG